MTLYNRFGQPRRSRRIENPERMVKRDMGERQLGGLLEKLLPVDHILPALLAQTSSVRYGTRIVVRSVGSACCSSAIIGRRSKIFPAILVAIDGKEHHRLDLLETLNNAFRPKVR